MAASKVIGIAFDIEAAGHPTCCHPIVSIGCAENCYTDKIFLHRWDIKCSKSEIEPRCQIEHWDKNPGLWERIQADAVEPHVAWNDIADFLDFEHANARNSNMQIKILSDNPAYDIGEMDKHLARYTRRKRVREDEKGKWNNDVEILDVDSMMRMIPSRKRASIAQPRPHMPDEDAKGIFLEWQACEAYKKELEELEAKPSVPD